MVTMKDVAKLAGVSHGTVSNVVNGVKNVSVDKIKKVEAAMEALGYKPNSAARNLKMEFTRQIDLVVPNMITGEFLELYEAIRKCAEKENYTLNLKVTDGIADVECEILHQSIMNNVDGVILVTCQPSNREFFEEILGNGLKIVFCVADLAGSNCNYVGFDISDMMETIIQKYRENGKRVALITGDAQSSYHDHLINTYCRGILQERRMSEEGYMEIIQVSPEYAAKGAAKLLSLEPKPDVVIVSNEIIAHEIHKMEYLLSGDANGMVDVVILNHAKTSPFFSDEIIPLPFKRVGKTAYEILMQMIQGEGKPGNRRTLIPPDNSQEEENAAVILPKTKKQKLRILLNDSPSSDAVKVLLPNFTRKTGIEAEVVTRKISEIYDTVQADRNRGEYDIYSVDVPWLKELVEKKMISCLDDFVEENAEAMSIYQDKIWERFSRVGKHFYGIPYGFSVQLLFYRKDLFDKIKNQRLHYEWYKEELKVPETWEQFNKIARLFTRRYNPDSETIYGVTLGGSAYSGAACEFIPRLWAYGCDVFEKGKILPKRSLAVQAMDNYLEAFRYASPKAVNWWWDEQVDEFLNGRAAMMMMFTEHASALVEKNHSKIAGKYQVAILPGKTNVLGGWSLAMKADSPNREAAYEFLKWISRRDLMEQNAILGRVYPVIDPDSCESMDSIYNWYDVAVEGYESARARKLPDSVDRSRVTEVMVEKVVGQCVHQAIVEKKDGENAVKQLKYRLEMLMSGVDMSNI